MAGQFYAVSQSELEDLLLPMGFKQISVRGTRELVYSRRCDQDGLKLSLRVYSGIEPTGVSRDVGADAFRVNLFLGNPIGYDTERKRTVWETIKLGGSKRVHRIAPSVSNPEGWRKNLRERIEGWIEYLPTEKCQKCGMPMIPRNGKNGIFLSCSKYPTCRNSRSLPQEMLKKPK